VPEESFTKGGFGSGLVSSSVTAVFFESSSALGFCQYPASSMSAHLFSATIISLSKHLQ
jgi:hypothetical protein